MLVVFFSFIALVAGDWPQFRGPNSDGHATGPFTPTEWSDSKNIAWKVPIEGLGWSSPAVVDGKVFLTTAVAKDKGSTPSPLLVGDEPYFVSDNGIASCVDAKTGKSHWMERLGGNFSASPIFANGRVLFLNENGLATWVQLGKEFAVLGKNEVPGRTTPF